MKTPYFCERCRKRLVVQPKAIKTLGRIINVVSVHECSDIPVELDLKPEFIVPFNRVETKKKTVKNLDELTFDLSKIEDSLMDRRPVDQVKTSSAPSSILEKMRQDLGKE